MSQYDRSNQIEIIELTLKRETPYKVADISALLDQLIIFEDLFQASLSARLIFRDQLNMVGTFPIVGGETINIKYRTPVYSDVISLDFIVYKIGERGNVTDTDNIQINQLYLCTPEVWWTSNNDITNAFRGTYTDIIKAILKLSGSKKPFDSEESVGLVSYVSPSWDMFRAIKFCASRANTKTSSPMFFWESTDGYHLKSMKELYREKYDKFIYITNRNMAGAESDHKLMFNTAYQFEYLESNNRLAQYTNNDFGADNFSVDISNARINKDTKNYKELFHKMDIKLNKYPLNNDVIPPQENIQYIPHRSDNSHNIAFYRQASLNFMDNLKVLVSIPGDSKLKTGDVVWMDIPVQVGLEVGFEPHSSGKWLTRSIKHLITKTTYSMTCELTKDSFDSDISKG